MKIRVLQTGKVYVSHALPFKDDAKNPNPLQLSLLSLYGRRNRIWLPVSAYLIEHINYKILVDTGWHRAISPEGEYNRRAQVKHMGLGHFLLNQGFVPKGESLVEQLAKINIPFVTLRACGAASSLKRSSSTFSDGGYAKKSWQNLIPPGTALDEELALKSLLWIREMSLQENCIESLANHDPDIVPHEIIF